MTLLIQLFVAILFFLFLYKLWKWYKTKMLAEDVDEQVHTVKAEGKAAKRIPKDLQKESKTSKKKLDDLKKINSK